MSYRTITIPPLLKLVSDEVIEKLRERQEAVAQSMGRTWLLHPDNSPQSKSREVKP